VHARYNMCGVISASQDGSGSEDRGWRQHKRFTRPPDAFPGLAAASGVIVETVPDAARARVRNRT